MNGFKETPWDQRVYGIPTFEITDFCETVLEKTDYIEGHFTIKVDPLDSKRLLHKYGFYYCDTLITPVCHKSQFKPIFHDEVEIATGLGVEEAARFCTQTFLYDRFHRDFHLDPKKGDLRYVNWLKDIAQNGGEILGLWYQKRLAGFFAYQESHILLHALGDQMRGKGLAKFLWSKACARLFDEGWLEISSSVSAANLAIVNLYRSLGFSFRNPVDVYHKYRAKE